MCVGFPAKIKSIKEGLAVVDALGAQRQISIELLPELKPGDHVMVHAGIAIAKITAEEAEETRAIMEEVYGQNQ
jgi:hydrogenase expression/formation protein HypC